MSKENWISGAISSPGSLHRQLNIPQGKKIPEEKLQAKEGDSTLMKRRKALARTLAKFKK